MSEAKRLSKLGSKNPQWKGDAVNQEGGRSRARNLYPAAACEDCGSTRSVERHHKDGNTLNNAPDNVSMLCRRCHMKVDGRLEALNGPDRRAKINASIKGTKGRIVTNRPPISDEQKAKLAAVHRGRVPWNKGKHWPADVRAKISAAKRGRDRATIISTTWRFL